MDRIKEDNIKGNIKNWYQFVIGNRATDIIILIVLVFIVHRGWFRPGMLDYGDMWTIPKEALVEFFSFPYIWKSSSYLGVYDPNLFTYPHLLLSGLVACLGFGNGISQRVVYFFPYLFISIFSIYYFTYVLFKNRTICFFATLFFVFNTYILQLVAGGILDAGIAYALAPVILAFFIKGLQQKQLKNGILAGVFLSLSIAYYPPTAYLTIGAVLLFFVAELISQIKNYDDLVKKKISKLISYLIFVLIIPVILHFYGILPALLVKVPKVHHGHESAGWVYALSYAKLSHAISIYNVWWPPGSEGVQPVRIQYFIIPLLVLLGIVACFKYKNVRLLAIIAVISVFFAKGINKPFGEVYAWFFKYFPGGSMFRTPGKFHCLTNLAYAPLLGVGIYFIANVLRKIELRKLKIPFKRNILKPIFLVFMFCFMMYLVFPALAGKISGTFNAKRIPKEYEEIKKFIKIQPPHFRTFWRPIKGRYAFYSQEYPLLNAYQYSSYSSDSSRYFLAESYNPEAFRQTEHIAKILGILNIKYCFLPLEKEYFSLDKDDEFYFETFEKQIGLKKINIGKNIDAFENQYVAARFFATPHAALVVGGMKALFLLASLEEMDFSRWAVFFADELKASSIDLFSNIELVVFYDRDINDLVLALVGEEYRVDLTKYVIPRSDSGRPGRWVKSTYPPEQTFDGAITHSPKGIIFRHRNVGHSSPSELNPPIPIDIKEAGDYEIWVRPVQGPNRGKLSIWKSKDPENYAYTFFEDFENPNWKEKVYFYKGFREHSIDLYNNVLAGYDSKEKNTGELIYKIEAPSPIGRMWMVWDTLVLSESRIGRFFVSEDCKYWIQAGENQIVDEHPYQVDITNFVKGKELFYIKFQLENKIGASTGTITNVGYHYETISTKEILKDEDLKGNYTSFKWIEADSVYLDKGKHFFQIIHHPGPIGIVDQFVVIPKKIIDSLRQDISKSLRHKNIVIIKEPDSLSFDISIPKDGKYRIVANTSNHNFSGNLIISINGNKIKEKKLSNNDRSLWMETKPIRLKEGISRVNISTQGNGKIELKQIVLYKTNLPISSIGELFKTKERIPVIWKMINPTKYQIKLKVEKPTYLIFSEGYDPHWKLNTKQPVSSKSAYSLINSFFIEHPGEIEAILEFTPQRYVYKGLSVSGIGLALICFYFLLQAGNSFKKRKHNK